MKVHHYIVMCLVLMQTLHTQAQIETIVIHGVVKDCKTKQSIQHVGIKLSNYPAATIVDSKGEFNFTVPKKPVLKLIFFHPAYQSLIREIKTGDSDTIHLIIELATKSNLLDTVSIFSKHEAETLVGKPNFSIYDFDFYEDKLLLLCAERSLDHAQLKLADYSGKIFSSIELPKQSGTAKNFFHDYEGYTDVVCEDTIFRIDVWANELILNTINRKVFNNSVKPVTDTAAGNYYFSNYSEKYPSFNYYYLQANDSVAQLLKTISNSDLLKLYNFEYYYLPSRMQLEARRIADYYKTDVHIVAAMMSGFTQSMYYDALYAPLFVFKDTICIFNHYNDQLYHYDLKNKLIDSVKINYHHPKNWRDWKHQLFVDEPENKVYAFYSKDGHHYLKQIDHHTGKEIFTYKLKQHSAEKIKIKDGYVYYVYRPFGSTQERFLYRERIE